MPIIPVYNQDARRRIAESVRFTENYSRDRRDLLRRGGQSFPIVALTSEEIGPDAIGQAARAEGPAFDTGLDPTPDEEPFDVWNPSGETIAAGRKVIIEPVVLRGYGIGWAIVAPFTGTVESGTVSAVSYQSAPASGYTKPVSALDPIVPIASSSWAGGTPLGFLRGSGHTVVAQVKCRVTATTRISYQGVATGFFLRVNSGTPSSFDIVDSVSAPASPGAFNSVVLTASVPLNPNDYFHIEAYTGGSTITCAESSFSIFGVRE